ncbi:MAG: hypothetical protein ABIH37_03645 [archaeon]
MKFEDFTKEGNVKKASPDKALVKSLVITANSDLKFLDRLEINKNSSRKIMVNYYDVLRSILEAISSLDGYKIYSHEAFTYYLKEKSEEVLSIKFDRFRKIRNSINYYGKNISIDETKENVKDIKNMINVLINKYLNEI